MLFMKLFSRCTFTIFSISIIACAAKGATTNLVRMGTYFFNPTNVVIRLGDRVVWTNTSDRAHDSTSRTNLWIGPNVGTAPPNNAYGFTFTNLGYYPYYCRQHLLAGPQQTGSVSVVNVSLASPRRTTTNAQFEIRGGFPGLKAVTEGASALGTWVPIGTNAFPASGTINVADTNASLRRFYRARVIP